jgi:transcriptional regulator with XRE-family HTH domain
MKKTSTAIRLNQIMNEKGLKQVDVLRLAEPFCKKYDERLGKNDLSQYASGKTEPGQRKLFILGKALGVNPSWLLGLDVSKNESSEKKEDAVSDIFIRLRQDDTFYNAVKKLYSLKDAQLSAVITMLSSFEQD